MDISRISGLSKSTVSLQIKRLKKLGMIEEKNSREDVKRKIKLKIKEDLGFVAGVFLGATGLSIIIFDLDMGIKYEKKLLLDYMEDPCDCHRQIISALKSLCHEKGIRNLWGIGIGIPFPVNFREGRAGYSPYAPLWDGYPLRNAYEKEFGCPVIVDNDVNVMALGEGAKGNTAGESNFFYIKTGTGMGAGIIIDGKVYRGAQGCAGDIGHIAVNGSDMNCICGNRGCLEAVAGGRTLAGKAAELASSGRSPFLAELRKESHVLTAAHIREGALSGDRACIQLIQNAGGAIGEVTALLVNFFNPSTIAIGGDLAGSGNLLVGAIRKAVANRSHHLPAAELNIRLSELGEKSGPTGAGLLILNHIFSEEQFPETIKGLGVRHLRHSR